MKMLHYYTGITVSLFVGLHLLNHLMILHSEEAHIRFMKASRKIYRNPLIEAILLLAVLVQVITGFCLVVSKWNRSGSFFDWVQIISGLYLSLFLVVHVTAVFMGRYKLHMDTNLYYGAGVMNMWPHKLIFIPYYSLALLSFFFHVAAIHRGKMEKYVSLHAAELQAYLIMFLGIIITQVIIVKLSNLKTETSLPAIKEPAV